MNTPTHRSPGDFPKARKGSAKQSISDNLESIDLDLRTKIW
jgi:hypothetical protein